MQVVAKRTLRQSWDRHSQAEGALRLWYTRVARSDGAGPADVKADFGASVDFVADSRLIFDIAGNHYRLVVHVA